LPCAVQKQGKSTPAKSAAKVGLRLFITIKNYIILKNKIQP